MRKIIHRAETRGHSCNDWLRSYHTFSCDDYYDAERISFGALRILNDNRITPGMGFSIHPHKNMEIITIPLSGELQYGDSKKVQSIIGINDIQLISAGTGIFHSEKNSSKIYPVEFLQIWIMPRERNAHPNYQRYTLNEADNSKELIMIAGPDDSTPLLLLQNAWVSMYQPKEDKTLKYQLHQSNNGVYIFVINGKITFDDIELNSRDGIGIFNTNSLELKAIKNSRILIIEVPL